MAKIIIFGNRDHASLAHFYLNREAHHDVVAFSVNSDYCKNESSFEGLPLLPFEAIEKQFDPAEYRFFAPMSYRKMNRLRGRVYKNIKAKGYRLVSYVSDKATVFRNTEIGENCFILEDNTIQPFTRIGNNVMIWSGNHIGHHSVINDHVYLTSHVVISGHCIIDPYSFFGVNATIKNGIHIKEGTLVGMSAAITSDTRPWSIYKGSPASASRVSSKRFDL